MCGKCKISLFEMFPKLMKEWFWEENNKIGLDPRNIAPYSHKKTWWKCNECGDIWFATIKNRTRNNNGCSVCNNQKPTASNNLLVKRPEDCKEWDYDKNELGPENYLPHSSKRVWWKCQKCGHEWETSPNGKAGCRNCNNLI